jgi:hypothetical protein
MIHIIEEDEVEWGVHLLHLLVKEELRCMVWLPTMWVPTLVFLFLLHPSNNLLIGDNENFPINLDAFHY